MKSTRSSFILILIILVASIFVSSCAGKSEGVAWKYQNKISQPLEVVASQQEVKAGDLATHQFQLTIPANAFDSAIRITVQTPKEVPAVNSKEFTPIGAPVEVGGAATRLNQPAVLTFQVDKSKYASDLKAKSIWVAYYDGDKWTYFKPSSTDTAAGVVTYTTFHFSLFGAGKISVEERINQYAHSQALGKLAQDKVDDVVDEMVKNTVEYLLKKRMGLDDEAAENSIKFKIMSSLANDDEYKDLIDKFQEGDVTGFNETFNVFVGKKIAENLEDSMWKSTLEFVSDSGTDLIKAASEAAGYAAEGQYLEAGRILGTQIAEEFMITKIIQSGVEIVQYNIDAWKDAEIEAAYKAYKNGADNKFFGYNVDAGDFDAVWNQMRGIATRLESEAVNREIARRESMGMPAPTDRDLDKVRAQVRENLKEQFENRLKSEAEIEKNEAKIKALVIKFQESRLLENAMYGYDDTYDDMESRLDKLFHLTQKILRDTGRKDWNLTAFTNEREISANDVIALIKAWYSTNGREEYAKMLKERFKIGIEENTGIKGDFRLIPVFNSPQQLKGLGVDEKLIKDAGPIDVIGGVFSTQSTVANYESANNPDGITLHFPSGQCVISGTYNSTNGLLKGTVAYGYYQEEKDTKRTFEATVPFEATISKNDKTVTLSLKGTGKQTEQLRFINNKGEYTWTKPRIEDWQLDWDIQFEVEIIRK